NWIGFFTIALAALTGAQAAGKPNIVLIMADDMGYECVTANGGESYSTPNRVPALRKLGMCVEYSAPNSNPIKKGECKR
ncbi:MAG: hypothetical protein OSA89_18765, partial [Mariniblastus sp.]|nr:hypothetical protein [Mariniblastus sp.]